MRWTARRAATTHFWNPPHLMPLAEIVQGMRTSEETVRRLREVLIQVGKSPVVVRKDVPGQLGNRLLHAITREAMNIVQEGIATAEEVDTAIKTGLGLRFPVYGPLEHADLVGLDLLLSIQSYLFEDLCNRTDPMPILREKTAQGDLGARTGRGFYDWSRKDADQVKATRDAFLMARLRDLYPPKQG
ncbi:MAG: 3-hydroxyacyl-CoA dehydrogenase family protein [Chloroflexi bacterium]|nr:3-hydroxyacyl-CoA dehydrogenase family protein [Chloroflexota bacterium]